MLIGTATWLVSFACNLKVMPVLSGVRSFQLVPIDGFDEARHFLTSRVQTFTPNPSQVLLST